MRSKHLQKIILDKKKGSKPLVGHLLFFASLNMSVCVMVEVSKLTINMVKEENNLALP